MRSVGVGNDAFCHDTHVEVHTEENVLQDTSEDQKNVKKRHETIEVLRILYRFELNISANGDQTTNLA